MTDPAATGSQRSHQTREFVPADSADVAVRREAPSDVTAIRALHEAASPGAGTAALVDRLRDGGYARYSLVASRGDAVIGHAMFSHGFVDGASLVVTVGPVAVLPQHQRTGAGSSLMRDGVARCRRDREIAIFVLGDPHFYERFGFDVAAAAPFASPYSGPHLQGLILRSDQLPSGGTLLYPTPFADLP